VSGHGILHGVAQQQQQRQIKRGHLADFAFSRQPDPQQHEHVNDRGAQGDLQQRVPTREHRLRVYVIQQNFDLVFLM